VLDFLSYQNVSYQAHNLRKLASTTCTTTTCAYEVNKQQANHILVDSQNYVTVTQSNTVKHYILAAS